MSQEEFKPFACRWFLAQRLSTAESLLQEGHVKGDEVPFGFLSAYFNSMVPALMVRWGRFVFTSKSQGQMPYNCLTVCKAYALEECEAH